jgi:hypothetical protein
VQGPYYWDGAPDLPLGADIAPGVRGEPAFYSGRVTDTRGQPLANALLDIWSGDGEGVYDMQVEGAGMAARARIRTDAEGRYWFWSIKPSYYPVPVDGPVGRMLAGMGRHPNRPGHIHMKVAAEVARAGDHAPLRRGQPLHRLGRGVRRAAQPRRRLRIAPARQGARRPRDRAAVLVRALRLPSPTRGRLSPDPPRSTAYVPMKIGKSTVPAHRHLHLGRTHHRRARAGPVPRPDRQALFADYFFLLLTGKQPDAACSAVLNATLVAIAEHGLVPSVQAAA